MGAQLEKENPLVHCVFVSSSRYELDEQTFDMASGYYKKKILGAKITGVTLYEGRQFFQVIEGYRDEVEALYQSYCFDNAHRNMVKIVQEPIRSRAFSDWTAAYGEIGRRLFSSCENGRAYFAKNGEFSKVASGRAKQLIGAFLRGRWRG